MQSIQSAAGLALLLGAASTAAFTLPPTRRAAPRTRISATNEDWRQACDSDGVVSYYDYGVRLGGADSDAAVAASLGPPQRLPGRRAAAVAVGSSVLLVIVLSDVVLTIRRRPPR